MRRLLWLGCGAYLVAWLWAATTLPARVPLHFGSTGDVDRWGSREEALVTFALIGLLVAGLLTAGLVAVHRSRFELLNVPHKEWWTATPERRERLRRLAVDDVAVVGAATMALLTVALLGTVVAADAPEPALPWWFLGAFGAYLVGVLGWCLHVYRSRYRPDEGTA